MTTPNMNKSLSDIFDVELTKTDKTADQLAIEAKQADINSLERQRKYVQQNLVELLEKGKILLDNMTTIANSTEASKDFDVAAKILKTLVDTNVTLLDSEVSHKPVENVPQLTDGNAEKNSSTVFVGSASDFAKLARKATTIDVNNK